MRFFIREILALLALFPAAEAQDKGSVHKPEAVGKNFVHSASCPRKCKTCSPALAKACAYLAKTQSGSGAWQAGNGGTVVVTSIAGLALMANGSTPFMGPYAKNIEKAAKFLIRTVAPGYKGSGKTASGQTFEGFGNWDLGFSALFLSEYFFHKPTADLQKALLFIMDKIKGQRETNGGWGHAPNFAYRDLTVVTTACMAGLGAMKSVGLRIPEDVVSDGVKYLESTSAGGTVGYSPRSGQKGWGHAGRASGAAFAMFKCGVQGKYFDRVIKFVRSGVNTIHKDHASPTLHYLMGGIFSFVLGPQSWNEYRQNYLNLWLAMQQEDGRVLCPTDADVKASLGMDTDVLVGPGYTTATFALVFALPHGFSQLPKQKAKKVKKRNVATAWKREKGKPFLGFRAETFADSLDILHVVENGPSARVGLIQGDLLVEFKGKKILRTPDLQQELAKCSPGQRVSLLILRGGEKKTLVVQIGTRPQKGTGDVKTGSAGSDQDGELF